MGQDVEASLGVSYTVKVLWENAELLKRLLARCYDDSKLCYPETASGEPELRCFYHLRDFPNIATGGVAEYDDSIEPYYGAQAEGIDETIYDVPIRSLLCHGFYSEECLKSHVLYGKNLRFIIYVSTSSVHALVKRGDAITWTESRAGFGDKVEIPDTPESLASRLCDAERLFDSLGVKPELLKISTVFTDDY